MLMICEMFLDKDRFDVLFVEYFVWDIFVIIPYFYSPFLTHTLVAVAFHIYIVQSSAKLPVSHADQWLWCKLNLVSFYYNIVLL